MKNKLILKPITVFMILGFVFVYLFASATALAASEKYLYASQTGEIKYVMADSVSEAFVKATDIALHSGVMLVDSSKDESLIGEDVLVGVTSNNTATYGTGGSENNLYLYVDVNGNLREVLANSPEEAIAIAANIDPHSGVKRVNVYPE